MAVPFLHEFGKAFVPEKFFGRALRANLHTYLKKAGYVTVPYTFFGLLFLITAAITYGLFIPFIYPALQGKAFGAVFILSFLSWALIQLTLIFLVIFSVYFFLNIRIYKRTKIIEDKLPDFLVLVSTNLKGGLSLEQSLWASIRPEFGLLAQEMTVVSKRVMTGNDLNDALAEFIDKYDAPTLKRNLSLIVGEIESGGKIVKVIDKVIDTLKKSKALKQEMAASTVSYMIFIGAVVAVISPALFALAFQLLQIIIGFTQSIGSSLTGSASTLMPISFDVQIDVNDFKKFSVMALGTISLCSSLIMGIIEKGDMRGGIKYIPAFIIISIILYFVFMIALASVFGGIV
jgi:pilus assembly protein TadC